MKKSAFTPTPIFYNIRKPKLVWGFTLVELLIVIVIIGVLVTIMYPNFEGMRIRARLKEIYTTVEIIKAAQQYYYAKKGAYYMVHPTWGFDGRVCEPTCYNDLEENLNIIIPKGNDAFCYYSYYVSDVPVGTNRLIQKVYTKDKPVGYTGWIYAWASVATDGETDVSWRNLGHAWGKYLTADRDGAAGID